MDCVPFPAPLSPLPVSVLRCAPDAKHLDEAEHFLHNRKASVASLRSVFGIIPESRSASLRKGVRLQRNPHRACSRRFPQTRPFLRTCTHPDLSPRDRAPKRNVGFKYREITAILAVTI
jgi:hypothetical protein